ncbi:MAG: hypothetical protein JAY74_25580 [Candidatus Thiodiazotropha taylori]|nr:hypothetical protein [Candidatus Thiodiazotropha taylori]
MLPSLSKNGYRIIPIYEELYELSSSYTQFLFSELLDCLSCSKSFTPNGCLCGDSRHDPYLKMLYEENYCKKGTFWGLYIVEEGLWSELLESFEEDIKNYKSNCCYLRRYKNKENVEDVQNWIDSAYPGNNLVVKNLSIPSSSPPRKSEQHLHSIYQSCFRESDTKLHGYLKWFSYCYLTNRDSNYFDPNVGPVGYKTGFEVYYSLPGNRVIKQYLGGTGSIVSKKHVIHWHWNSCIQKIADVYSGANKGLIVECGSTDSLSLVAPIKARIAKRVIWFPYPDELDKNDDIENFDTTYPAYLIHNKQPAHLRKNNKKKS